MGKKLSSGRPRPVKQIIKPLSDDERKLYAELTDEQIEVLARAGFKRRIINGDRLAEAKEKAMQYGSWLSEVVQGYEDESQKLREKIESATAPLRKELAEIEKRIATAKADAIVASNIVGDDHKTFHRDGFARITIVRPTSISYDVDGIKSAVTTAQWRSITSTAIDTKKLTAAMSKDDELTKIVAANSEPVTNKPYAKVTYLRRDEGQKGAVDEIPDTDPYT